MNNDKTVVHDGETEDTLAPVTRKDLAKAINVEDKTLVYYLYRYESETGDPLYRMFSIPKANGEMREIQSPISPLKRIQRNLADFLNTQYQPRNNVYGFVEGRSAVDGARIHVNSKILLNIDLKDFFGTVNFGRVRGELMGAPYHFGENAATVAAQIACRNNRLPQGAPSSPILANMVCSHLDTALIRFARKYHLHYTRYADDITFSPRNNANSFSREVAYIDENGIATVGTALRSIIEKSGFEINKEKVFIQNNNQRQAVTGIVVNKKVNVPKQYISLTRAMIFHCQKDGVLNAAKNYVSKAGEYYKVPSNLCRFNEQMIEEWFQSVILGRIAYIGAVKGKRDDVYIDMARKYNKAFQSNAFRNLPDKEEKTDIPAERLAQGVVLIETETGQGSGFYVKGTGIITCYHCVATIIEEIEKKANVFSVNMEGIKVSLCQITMADIIRKNKDKDYAVISIEDELPYGFSIGDFNIEEGFIKKNVTLFGFPDYSDGDTIQVLPSIITRRKGDYLGSLLFSVSNEVKHGMSGGPVLDEKNQVIGIIKGGLNTINEELYDLPSGFVPVKYAIEK